MIEFKHSKSIVKSIKLNRSCSCRADLLKKCSPKFEKILLYKTIRLEIERHDFFFKSESRFLVMECKRSKSTVNSSPANSQPSRKVNMLVVEVFPLCCVLFACCQTGWLCKVCWGKKFDSHRHWPKHVLWCD